LLLVNCKFLHRAVPFIPGELVGELKRRISQHYWFRRRYRWANHDDMELRFKNWPLSDDTRVDTLGLYYMGHLFMRLKERKNNPVVKKEDLPLGFIVNFPALLETFSKNSK
jgi:ABC-type transporter Mla MlaB component